MPLTIYAFKGRPHDFAVTKSGCSLDECCFYLDFQRPLERLRWLGFSNKWIGFTTGLFVPVAHISERTGGFVISVRAGEPYFVDLPKLWKQHNGSMRTMVVERASGLEIVGQFGSHFAEDAQLPG